MADVTINALTPGTPSAAAVMPYSEGDITKSTTVANIGVPAGAIMAFAMNSVPAGWLSANGSAVSRTTYSALFAAIGTTHGAGDGSTTFNVPDLQGIFVRASGSQVIGGVTYNKSFANKEGDALQGHVHGFYALWSNIGGGIGITPATQNSGRYSSTTYGPSDDGSNGVPRTASETRPASIALLHCIKT